MVRRTYSVDELLSLRRGQVNNLIPRLARNPELSDIVRDSSSESSDNKPMGIKHKDDSSTSSEELLFKGNMSRRLARESAREPPREVIREVVREAVREPAREPTREPVYEPVHQAGPIGWKYRGRSESETPTNDPVAAPTGVPAQRSEGFQRFYKAVVSPTHVRVTAGGRIVPNNRGPPSPTSKRPKDSSAIDGQGMTERMVHGKPSMPQIGVPQPVPVLPPFIAGYPTGFQPIQPPLSFVPMAFGTHLSPGFAFPQPVVTPPTMAQTAVDNTLKDTHNTKPGDLRSENGAAVADKQEKVKVTPPEFFDCTKPFFFNGQYVYPVSAAFPGQMGMPFQMVSLPPGMAPMQGHMMQPATNGSNPMMSAGQFAPSSHNPAPIPVAFNQNLPVNAKFQSPSAPPISSIRLSEVTKKQIAAFKQALKYNEDQLQFNRHQIDEKDMEVKIQTLQDHIRRFEATLKAQLEHEEAVLRKPGQNKDSNGATQSADPEINDTRVPAQPAAASELDEHGNAGTQGVPSGQNHHSVDVRQRSRSRPGVDSNHGESSRMSFEYVSQPHRPVFPDMRRPGLPSDAALAPIFQPRGYASSWGGSETSREPHDIAPGVWKVPRNAMEEQQSSSQSFTASNYFDDPPVSNHIRAESNFGVPYLLGALPKGLNPRMAKDQDYVYNRPLTDEERRARFLYWGKAPKSVTQGLPKFDGKHFYPPSPVKEKTDSPHLYVPSARANADFAFRVTKSDGDPFRPITPIQRSDVARVVVVSEDGGAAIRHVRSCETQIYSASSNLRMPSGDGDFQEPAVVLESCENSVDGTSVGSHERRPERPGSKFWQTMLKKGSTSSALSSTTAQGLLPQYSGNAAASLSPSVNKNPVSPIRETSPVSKRDSDYNEFGEGGVLLTPATEKRGENRPPKSVSSLEDQFKNISAKGSDHRDLTPTFGI
ncbi:hypothetical protein B0T17DRAFT_385440 [Bombardia bombarda]|uniref:Uncharacterized protein n=1 Tax=Bombardia bombarda TaxID=252184 RepID=A0AA39U6F7_9PEZI|nr:hypothetical protein B0T17DRAFT_385440 [Bombardia bombarda]